ncbi:MAG: phosphotransferase family protein [Atopobiaceae bacterium]
MANAQENVVDPQALWRYVTSKRELAQALLTTPQDMVSLKVFAQGEYNVNFVLALRDGRQFLVRVNVGSQLGLKDQIGYEMAALALLAQSGRTPAPYFADGSREHFPFGVGVEELLPGRPLNYETDLGEAAHILADIHSMPVPAKCILQKPKDGLAAMVAECRALFSHYERWAQADAAVIRRIERMFFSVEKRLEKRAGTGAYGAGLKDGHIINTELNSSNFLINPDKSYLIDWEKPLVGDVAQDLAHLLVPTTTFWKTDVILTRQERRRCVEKYRQAVGDRFSQDGLEERLGDYETITCLRGVTWCAMALVEYASSARPVTNQDTFEKIKIYESPDFLDMLLDDWFGETQA